jgi:hypothetical protein
VGEWLALNGPAIDVYPGEKRLLAFAHSECALVPTAMDADIAAVLAAAGAASAEVVLHLTRLLDRLDELLTGVGFDANTGYGAGA